MNCSIAEPMFGDSRKYFTLELDSDTVKMIKINHVKKAIQVKTLVDPLTGNLLKVKIPFRYNRVMCKVTGQKTIQEMVKGIFEVISHYSFSTFTKEEKIFVIEFYKQLISMTKIQ